MTINKYIIYIYEHINLLCILYIYYTNIREQEPKNDMPQESSGIEHNEPRICLVGRRGNQEGNYFSWLIVNRKGRFGESSMANSTSQK